MVLYVQIIKKAKKEGGKRKKYIHLYIGINKLKKFGVIKHIYHLIKLKGVRSLFKRIRFKMYFKNFNGRTRSQFEWDRFPQSWSHHRKHSLSTSLQYRFRSRQKVLKRGPQCPLRGAIIKSLMQQGTAPLIALQTSGRIL